jgi:hypothetical protein
MVADRRIVGAMVGGAVVGVALLGIVAIGEKAGWWHMAITWQPYFLTLMCIGTIRVSIATGDDRRRWIDSRSWSAASTTYSTSV